jgi:peptidoglycan/xylan/chitin deacetylase (PgdA/CDA1 family)
MASIRGMASIRASKMGIRGRIAQWASNSCGTLQMVDTHGKRVAALTFDDGPHPDFTPKLLDLLSRFGAKATFFLIGRKATAQTDLVQRILREGHALGNHTWNHAILSSVGWRERSAEIKKGQAVLPRGGRRLLRPPHGRQNIESRLHAWTMGYEVVGWSEHVHDWVRTDEDLLAQRLSQSISPGAIILLHDAVEVRNPETDEPDRSTMLNALEAALAANGDYEFVTVPRLLEFGRPVRVNWYR